MSRPFNANRLRNQIFRAQPPGAALAAAGRTRGPPQNLTRTQSFLLTGVLNAYAWPRTPYGQWGRPIQDAFNRLNAAFSERVETVLSDPENVFKRIRLFVDQDGHRRRGAELAPLQPGDITNSRFQGAIEVGSRARGRRMHFHALVSVTFTVLQTTDGVWGITVDKEGIKRIISEDAQIRSILGELAPNVLNPETRTLDRLRVDFLRTTDQVYNYVLKEQVRRTVQQRFPGNTPADARARRQVVVDEEEGFQEIVNAEDGAAAVGQTLPDNQAQDGLQELSELVAEMSLN